MNRRAEIRARLDAIIAEIDNAEGETLTALETEQRSLIDELARLDAEAQSREAMRARAASLGVVIETAPADNTQRRSLDEIRGSEEYANAFVEMIRSGNDHNVRSLLSDLVDGGTVPTPISLQEAIETSWDNTELVRRARHVSVPGTLKIPFELSATAAQDHAEGADAPAEETLSLGMVSIVPGMIKKWITISDEVIALKGQRFLDYINAEIAQRIAEKADDKLVGVIKACPAVATATAVEVPVVTVQAIGPDTIFKALAELSADAKNPVAIMNRKTYFNGFMALKDLQGRPIYNVVTENGRPTYYINGIETVFTDALTADTELIVGDLDGAVVNFPEGSNVVMKYDDKSMMERDLVKVLGRQYVGMGVVKRKYFVKVNVSA